MGQPLRCLAAACVAFFASNGGATDRALIMTIGLYPASPLPGATLDEGNARRIFSRLGVDPSRIRSLRDKELSASGIEAALTRLVAETGNGDRVFVHFSGHGTSQAVEGRCQQSLVGHDMKMVSSKTLADSLQQLKDKASKVVVTIDACHSGGVVDVAGKRGQSDARNARRFRPRFVETSTTCAKPSNVVEETINAGMRSSRGAPVARNFLYLAAARHDEVAYDDEGRGGMATTSLLECLNSTIPDADSSGGVSFRELADCAQKRIDKEFASDPVYRPHHLTWSGNADLLLPVEAAHAPAMAKANAVATLRDMQNGSDNRWQVQVEANPSRAKIGKDAVKLTVTSSQGGYLYLLYVGSDRKEFLQLYPERNEPNWISANHPLRIPGEFAASGPAGTNHLLALVSRVPRDFRGILGQGTAPATLTNAAALQDVVCSTRNLKRRECQAFEPESKEATRNLKAVAVAEGEADSYGAALIELVEW
jgi:hypothetical protein